MTKGTAIFPVGSEMTSSCLAVVLWKYSTILKANKQKHSTSATCTSLIIKTFISAALITGLELISFLQLSVDYSVV